jgi:uncharacterized membrane protein YuzA (DUF378 family)
MAQALIFALSYRGKMRDFTSMYVQKKAYMLAIFLVLVGSVNWLSIGLGGEDLVRCLLPPRFAKWVYIIVGLAALPLIFQRDIYLPFLGETVVPGGALVVKTPQNANDQVTVRTRPGTKVIYWAAEPNPNQGKDLPTPDVAYGEFENSGVVMADTSGHAILRFRGPPQAYTVPVHGRLEPHVHFRVEDDMGFLGRVQSIFLKDGRIEGFGDYM